MMKYWITQLVPLFLLTCFVYAQDAPVFKQQTIDVPVGRSFGLWPYWTDINNDGLTDLLALIQEQGTLYIYNQKNSGFSTSPDQSIKLPEDTMWITLFDVSEHSGHELLISTTEGLSYYRQNNGVLEIEPEKLIEAEQVFISDHPPIAIEPDKWPEDSKNTIPVVFPNHTVIYKLDTNYKLNAVRSIEHQFKKTMEKFGWNSWSVGSKNSDQIRIKVRAEEKSPDHEGKDYTKEVEYIKKTVEKIKSGEHQAYDILTEDINGDEKEDITLVHLAQEMGVKTTVMVFLRRKDNKLPEKPDQVLRCRGFPLTGDYPDPSHFSPLLDINNDGLFDVVLMQMKNLPTSVSAFIEILTSKGATWTLTVRLFTKSKGYSDRADFEMDFKAMLPLSENFKELIKFEGDFNADGRKDLIVRRAPGCSDVYFSSLSNGFFDPEPGLQLEVPQKGWTNVKDLNSDSISDIYVVDYENGKIMLLLSQTPAKQGLHK